MDANALEQDFVILPQLAHHFVDQIAGIIGAARLGNGAREGDKGHIGVVAIEQIECETAINCQGQRTSIEARAKVACAARNSQGEPSRLGCQMDYFLAADRTIYSTGASFLIPAVTKRLSWQRDVCRALRLRFFRQLWWIWSGQ